MHKIMYMYHVNLALVHEDAHTEQEGEEQFVFLKEGAADVAVQAEGEVVVDGLDAFLQVICGEVSHTPLVYM